MLRESFEEFVGRHKNIASFLAVAAALCISGAIFLFKDQLVHLRSYGYVGVFLLSLIGNATILLPMPSFVSVYIGGGLFNPLVVGLMASAGGSLGELTGYLVGVGGHRMIENRRVFIKTKDWLHRYGLFGVFAMALVPNPFFDMVGIAAGLLRIPVSHFLVATWMGQTLKFLLLSYLGAGSSGLMERFVQ